MSRWWLGMAVVAGCLLSRPALAQYPQPNVPTPYGAARTPPEPLPVGACPPPVPNLVPGPLTPDKAPAGPNPDCTSLPPDTPGAFQCETYPSEVAVYFDVGFQALQRQKLGKGAIAVTDQGNPTPTVKEGFVPMPNSPTAQAFNDITPNMAFGPRLTLGVLAGSDMFEVTGYYLPRNSRTTTAENPGRLFTYFFNAPPGFEGDNSLFAQVDRLTTTLDNQVGNVELNYRYNDFALTGFELIMGVRYFDVREKLSTTVDQDVLTHPLNPVSGKSNPLDVATYSALTQNRILAPQLGFEYTCGLCPWLAAGVLAKGAWGPNFVTDGHSLVRGDNFSGFNVSRQDTIFSQIYEIGAFAEVYVTERFKLRAGYNAMWVLDCDAVVDQYSFDLSKPQGPINHNGSILYHGPMFELQFLF